MDQKLQTPLPKTTNQRASSEFGASYLFKLRQFKKKDTVEPGEANFGGLWELTLLDRNGKVEKMISDADALVYCLENLQGELENDGF